MFNKTKILINKYKMENLAKHNLNNDIINNSNIEFIKNKVYNDANFTNLNKKENSKVKKANTKPKKIKRKFLD